MSLQCHGRGLQPPEGSEHGIGDTLLLQVNLQYTVGSVLAVFLLISYLENILDVEAWETSAAGNLDSS